MSGTSGNDPTLQRLAARTRELLEDLDHARQDVLAPVDLNRALKQVLRNQVAILEALCGAAPWTSTQVTRPAAAAATASPAPAPATTPPAGLNGATPRPARPSEPPTVAPVLREEAGRREEPGTPEEAGRREEAGTPEEPGRSLAEQLLQESRVLPMHLARSIVEEFDNRDKSYDKGLEKLNRWVAGGAGTPFQWRGDRAYLNLNGAGPGAVKNYEEQLMSRMGFSRRMGRLVVPGLQGEVIVYERPG